MNIYIYIYFKKIIKNAHTTFFLILYKISSANLNPSKARRTSIDEKHVQPVNCEISIKAQFDEICQNAIHFSEILEGIKIQILSFNVDCGQNFQIESVYPFYVEIGDILVDILNITDISKEMYNKAQHLINKVSNVVNFAVHKLIVDELNPEENSNNSIEAFRKNNAQITKEFLLLNAKIFVDPCTWIVQSIKMLNCINDAIVVLENLKTILKEILNNIDGQRFKKL
ncbi:hypothetical protein EDEG_03685 [Edhazardia aedis USNM 41457]|uniref:Uncharacterized protein n=1 Tax=Edhazardia aedis (strain USNM 41457) TaxID=1003232 RepID=J9D2M9_EDHAE|nr:hypothetical protein EDEG_03685 [Edhazardia aedis USNM 41457]|eukprot:EJW01839.1 hypothetical protein EDEG_03685 [Edhazardia aedis USNM 41457]